MAQKYTATEVSRHNSTKDLWIVLHGKVYDITKFLKEHPGGEEVLLNLAGMDGSKCFDDIGHSQEAIQLKDALQVGDLVGGSLTNSGVGYTEPTVDDEDWVYEEPKDRNAGYDHRPMFIGLGVLIYAIVMYNLLL